MFRLKAEVISGNLISRQPDSLQPSAFGLVVNGEKIWISVRYWA